MNDDENEFDIENVPDPEAENNLYEILDVDDSYFEDRSYTRKEKLKEIVQEERKVKRKEQEKHRAERTIHYEELAGMRRVIGMIDGILMAMLEDNRECRNLVHQLMASSTILRRLAMCVLRRHACLCLAKKAYKGSNEERLKEMKFTHDLVFKLKHQLDALTKLSTQDELFFEKTVERIYEEIEK